MGRSTRGARLGRRSVVAIALVLIAAAWMLRPLFSGPASAPVSEIRAAAATATPPEPVLVTVSDTLRRGKTLADLLADNGFAPPEIHAISNVVRDHKKPRTLRPGIVMEMRGAPGERPDRLTLQLDQDSLLWMSGSGTEWNGHIEVVPVVVDTIRLTGRIESSLWFAELGGDVHRLSDGEFKEYVYDLSDVFAWKVDFTRDIRKGDSFRVAIEREVRPDGSIRARHFLAVELTNRGEALSAIPFTRPGGRREYFDTDGDALRGAFLRYPVPYRITSGFTRRRFHPILKRYRPHQGIDYGAPYGTKVQATASGTVTRAGRWGGYGNVVELRHANGIRTRYAHLSSIAVRVGQRVDQGEVIGRVGATGLATASHLHYEFLQNGRHRNPLSVSVPASPPLEKKYMGEFGVVRDRALALLDGVEAPGPLAATAVADADEEP